MAVYCIAIALAGERQFAEVEGMGVDLDSMVEEDTEAAAAVVQGRCFVSGLYTSRSYRKDGSRSLVGDLPERAFALLRTIFEQPRRMARSRLAYVQWAAGRLGCSSSETSLAAEKLQIYLRMPHLFGRRLHDHNHSDVYSYPGSHSLPFQAI